VLTPAILRRLLIEPGTTSSYPQAEEGLLRSNSTPYRSARDQEAIIRTKAGLSPARLHDASFPTAIFGLPRHACSPSLYNHLSLDLPKTCNGDKSDRGIWIHQPDQVRVFGGTR
jgi:hypothetical protein